METETLFHAYERKAAVLNRLPKQENKSLCAGFESHFPRKSDFS
jgi:hypothetical protein